MSRRHIEPVLGHRKVREIGVREIEAWLNGLRRLDGRDGDLSSGTKRQLYATLRIILGHAAELRLIGAVPKLSRRRTPKAAESRKRVLSPAEEAQLLLDFKASPWMRPIVTVTLHQALRLGEVLALDWEDVDLAEGELHVRRSIDKKGAVGPTKGGREQTIPLTPKARKALLELRIASGGTGAVFRTRHGGRRQQRDVQRAFINAVRRTGLQDGVCFHSLRHTGISRLANHPGIPLVQVRDFARHADLAVSQGYMHKIDSESVHTAMFEALAGEAV